MTSEITVIRGGGIGDFVLTLPAIQHLRLRFPGLTLRLVGNPVVASLARPEFVVDHNSAALLGLYHDSGGNEQALESIFGASVFILAYTTEATEPFARRLKAITSGEVIAHDPRPVEAGGHMIEQLCAPLERNLNSSYILSTPQIDLSHANLTYWQKLAADYKPAPILVVHPGSGGERKCWPAECFADLIEQAASIGLQVVVILGPAEEKLRPFLESVVSKTVDIASPPDILQLAGVLHKADLYLGNDSGPSHIAAALGTPSVVLFGPTDPAFWGPRGRTVEILRSTDGKLTSLKVSSVLAALKRMLPR